MKAVIEIICHVVSSECLSDTVCKANNDLNNEIDMLLCYDPVTKTTAKENYASSNAQFDCYESSPKFAAGSIKNSNNSFAAYYVWRPLLAYKR